MKDRPISASAKVGLLTGGIIPEQRRTLIVEATEKYISAAMALDASAVIALLAEDVIYESQWVPTPLRGKKAVSDYIAAKFDTVRRSREAALSFGVGFVDLPAGQDYPVALLTQFGKRECFIALTLDESGLVSRLDFLGILPPASQVRLR